jgi:citronellyl-CoA dehydrogenase
MQNFQSERLVACTSATASAFGALDRTIAFGRDRHVMGKPIIKREYWQHRFVDYATELEAAKALSYKCCEAYQHEKYVEKTVLSMDTVKLISMAKIFVAELVSRLLDDCLQFHGGVGYIEEGWVARAWRDQRLLRIGGGTTEVMRYYVAKLMGM